MKTATQRIQKRVQKDEIVLHKLDKANQVIDQFITSCSHSMRGPLKSIRGLVNLLKDRTHASEISCEKVLGYVEENLEKMETMLDELEQFMVNSSKTTECKSVDSNELILQAVNGFREEIAAQSIGLMVESDQKVPLVSDPGRIRLVLTHLLRNAIQFQRPENPDKRIVMRSVIHATTCTFSIQDNGIGIQNDQCEKIFELFYRASPVSHGAGIGLFVVREALEKVGGQITVESTPGEGSVFTVTVPNRAR